MLNGSPITEIVLTEDGSSTLFVPDLNENYHSRYGALTESLFIYIGKGLHCMRSRDISIFEVGFGTGLNAFLSLEESISSGIRIHYDSIELHPLALSIVSELKYPSIIKDSSAELFTNMHVAEWDKETELTSSFFLRKIHRDFCSFKFDRKYDLVYFDAFAPQVQPELWTQERFDRISEAMNPGAIFITYSAMGEIRRRLVSAGLQVNRLPGPPGKREILQAVKT